jgi:hypothetical protein
MAMRPTDDQLSVFPVFFKAIGQIAVVVGNGAEALAKARLLTESRITIRLVAPAPSHELGAFIIQEDIDHIARPFGTSRTSPFKIEQTILTKILRRLLKTLIVSIRSGSTLPSS